VAVKATFRVEEGWRLVLADQQAPPALAPEYSGEPGVSSLEPTPFQEILCARRACPHLAHHEAPFEIAPTSGSILRAPPSLDEAALARSAEVPYCGCFPFSQTGISIGNQAFPS
jgi:hypothetical protein